MDITIQTDSESDSMYLGFASRALVPGAVEKTVRITENIAVDLDSEGRLVGLDVMNASNTLAQDYANVHLDELVGVKEAAELAGVQKSNFVRDYAARQDFPRPVAELATGRIWLRSQVTDFISRRKNLRPKAS